AGDLAPVSSPAGLGQTRRVHPRRVIRPAPALGGGAAGRGAGPLVRVLPRARQRARARLRVPAFLPVLRLPDPGRTRRRRALQRVRLVRRRPGRPRQRRRPRWTERLSQPRGGQAALRRARGRAAPAASPHRPGLTQERLTGARLESASAVRVAVGTWGVWPTP